VNAPPGEPRTAESRPPWRGQAVRFSSVGVLNTAVDFGVYFLLTRWLGFAGLPVTAKGISYGAGIANSYFWNRWWTFRSTDPVRATFPPFVLVNLAGLAINAGVMHLALRTLSLPELIALGLATGTAVTWNFAWSKFVVFRT